jgi:hypothetical protein
MAAGCTRRRQTMQEGSKRPHGNKGPDQLDKLILRQLVFEQLNHLVRPINRIVEGRIAAISPQKQAQCGKCGSLVTLLERMSSRHAVHQRYCKDYEVIFAIGKSIAWTRQRAFEQAEVPNEVMLSGVCEFELIVFDDSL